MAAISVERVSKRYGQVTAVRDLSLQVRDREFMTLLGPSGCGKTTLLRLIAGFVAPDDGVIRVDGLAVSSADAVVPPERRGMGMVFQNYAIWPHKTVYENVAFGLEVRRVERSSARDRVARVLELVNLAGLEPRFPSELSGGQQQRVALARSLVVEPKILLLDEPLSNLDAKLRERMRWELKELQRRTGITFVYVTHDQAEAMTMSDRIAVFSRGELQQFGTPLDIYRNPSNRFVATFVGSPPMSVFEGSIDEAGKLQVLGTSVTLPDVAKAKLSAGMSCDVGLRPEDVNVRANGDVHARVDLVEHLGAMTILHLSTAAGRLIAQSSANEPAKVGETVSIRIDPRALYVFDRASGAALVTPAMIAAN